MSIFNNIQVSDAEFEYFRGLKSNDRIHYLFEIYDIERHRQEHPNLNLTEFFNELDDENADNTSFDSYDAGNADGKQHRVDVMIDDETILIESNSLKAIRIIKSRFMENGFILQRDKSSEKMFKRDKMTRYLRVFMIINQIDPICYN